MVFRDHGALDELLVLSPAFESPDRLKLIEMVRQSEPVPPRSIDPRIPRDLETIVLKSIDKDPKGRYQSADELHEDLRRFVDDEPIKARRISMPERLLRWSRRNKGVAASLSAIGLLLLTAAVVSAVAATYFREGERKQRELAENEQIQRRLAEDRLRLATVTRLAAQAQAERGEHPVQSTLVALEAVRIGREPDGTVLPIAQETLLSTTSSLGGLPLVGHRYRVRALAISPDGRWLVSGSGDHTARVWDLDDPASNSIVLEGHPERVWSVSMTTNGSRVVTASPDGTVKVWDLPVQMPPLSTLTSKPDGGVRSVRIGPHGRWLITTGFSRARARAGDTSLGSMGRGSGSFLTGAGEHIELERGCDHSERPLGDLGRRRHCPALGPERGGSGCCATFFVGAGERQLSSRESRWPLPRYRKY